VSGHPVQEEDRIATGKIIATGVVSLLLFGVGAIWSVKIQRDEMKSIVTSPHIYGPTEIGKGEIGLVYQWPFNLSHYAADKVEAKKIPLDQFGWVDKHAGVVHIPIDQAIARYLATQATTGAGK
jgi:hypothetical protein